MLRGKATTKLIAFFVVAFICLNAGGAMCVAYCQTFEFTPEPEHCPLKRLSGDCHKAKVDDRTLHFSAEGNNTDCCPMTVSFVAGPLDTHSLSFDKQPTVIAIEKFEERRRLVKLESLFARHSTYRGPPPLDRRIERIKRRLLRI